MKTIILHIMNTSGFFTKTIPMRDLDNQWATWKRDEQTVAMFAYASVTNYGKTLGDPAIDTLQMFKAYVNEAFSSEWRGEQMKR